ncbi:CRISPR-associated endoribonuclease Cas6 [Metallosphaera hakonensis JCM 8857 = DSM 7519]|uniref:CRISPR-associated endoribonuclease Cas6 n=2 Tax=Metallosphaera hakonensis TaxID=79601 RepID=A0A2U9IWV7_9CREN|nr:CRISPR-associated endoribonuclease Cas6 [Metallosphaera hakonensis JCM 8857 = DSM 7519]
MMIAQIFVSPDRDAIVPPFTSKVGKSLLGNPSGVSISPLKKDNEYLFKLAKDQVVLEVRGGEIYSFEVGGEEEKVMSALLNLTARTVFNSKWTVEDVTLTKACVPKSSKFVLEIKTPALLVSPYVKSKRKVFTNCPSVLFFTNAIDVIQAERGEDKLRETLSALDLLLWPEPSVMKYSTITYAGKRVVGMMGRFTYSILNQDEMVYHILNDALAKGIGSSRKNGFGRIEIRVWD